MKHNQKLKKKLRDTIISHAVSYKDKKKNKKNKTKEDLNNLDKLNIKTLNNNLNNDNNNDNNNNTIDDDNNDTNNNDNIYRDQGYSRPRVLILCPYRGTALQIVNHIKTILGNLIYQY